MSDLASSYQGHLYLGPGNPLDNGQPTNRLDEDARTHDLDYSQPQATIQNSANRDEASKSIQEADETFLSTLSSIEPDSYTKTFE